MSDTITNAVIKKLYGLSAGKCNICKEPLFENDIHIGQMAHIIAKSPKGTRGNISFPNDNSYENLILLCANDHIRVDNDPFTYTVEVLNAIKKEHESHIAKVTNFSLFGDSKRRSDIEFLNAYFRFTPFERLRSLVDTLPNSFHINFLSFGDQFDCILMDLPTSYPLNDTILHLKFNAFITSYHLMYHLMNRQLPIENNMFIPYFGGTNHAGYCHFNYQELPFDKANSIERQLIKRKKSILDSYTDLILYIRDYFPEVVMRSPYF